MSLGRPRNSFFRSLRLHGSFFVRTFLSYLVITAASAGIVGFLAVRVSNQRILNDVRITSSYALESMRSRVEERVQKVDSIALQTMYNASTFRPLWSEDYGSTDLLIMRDLITNFRSNGLAQEWLHSIYLFNSRADYVLSTTKYRKAEFPDQEALRLPNAEGMTEYGPRRLANDTVITFVRTFSFFGNQTTGTVVVNVYRDRFFAGFPTDRVQPGFAVVSGDRRLLVPGGAPPPVPRDGGHSRVEGQRLDPGRRACEHAVSRRPCPFLVSAVDVRVFPWVRGGDSSREPRTPHHPLCAPRRALHRGTRRVGHHATPSGASRCAGSLDARSGPGNGGDPRGRVREDPQCAAPPSDGEPEALGELQGRFPLFPSPLAHRTPPHAQLGCGALRVDTGAPGAPIHEEPPVCGDHRAADGG